MYSDRCCDFRRQKCGREGKREGSKIYKHHKNKASKWSVKKIASYYKATRSISRPSRKYLCNMPGKNAIKYVPAGKKAYWALHVSFGRYYV